MSINPEQAAILQAVGGVVKDRLARFEQQVGELRDFVQLAANREAPSPHVTNQVHPPEVHVTNQVPTPGVVVQVDTTLLVSVIERQNELLARLFQALVDRPPPSVEVKPLIRVPELPVRVEAPQVTVEQPQRSKRRLTVKHGDGTTSTITEE